MSQRPSVEIPMSLAAAALLLALPGCGGSSDSGSSGTSGAVAVAVTDAPSDEVAAFVVEIESFVLHRSTGGTVSVLQSPVTVDLTSLTDFSQVLDIASVPVGSYIAADATFDFSDASVVLHDEGTPATLLDAEGNALTGTVTYPIQFSTSALSVAVSKHVLLELDFDLDQSVVVDAGLNTVWLEPVLALRIDPAAPKQLLAVGTLVSVDIGDNTFLAQVKTFGGAPSGTLEFLTVSGSVFQIDGAGSQGATGLAALALEPAGTSIQVWGAADPNAPRYVAAAVAAGTGTFNGGQDLVDGWVLGRSSGANTSPTLTVLGHSLDASHTTFQWDTSFQVSTSLADTQVVIPGTAIALDMNDVNIGQRVRIFGSLTGTNLSASAPGDVVVLLPTSVYGLADTAPFAGVQTLDLARIGPWPENLFNWVESGTVPTDPDAFTADIGGLGNGLGIGAGTPLEVRGFLSAVDASDQDLLALSVANLDDAPSLLFVRDLAGTGHTLDAIALTSLLQLDVTGTAAPGEVAVIDQGFAGSQPLPSSPMPALEPLGSGLGLFLVFDSVLGTTRLHLSFGAFTSDLAGSIAGGAHVRHVAAVGTWDDSDNRLSTALASAGLE
jgi:hypothetical protein